MAARSNDHRGVAPYPRALRVNQVLRQVVAEELERLADADERLRLVTVTGVDVSPDLRHAKVFLSSMSDEAAESLDERRKHLQREVGRQVRMKRTPQLVFAVDPAVVAGTKVEETLLRLQREGRLGSDGEGADDAAADDIAASGVVDRAGAPDAGDTGDADTGAGSGAGDPGETP